MNILIVGAGTIAKEYIKVCQALDCQVEIVGRGKEKTLALCEDFKIKGHSGGIENFKIATQYNHVIVAVSIDQLSNVTKALLTKNVKSILLEKPGGLGFLDIEDLIKFSKNFKTQIHLAYNRRYFSSVLKLKEILNQEKVLSCHFDFTEWGETLLKYNYPQSFYDNILLGNSSHVIDTAFSLIGSPKNLNCSIFGKTSWSDNPAIFMGMGISEFDIPFSYHSNWQSAGRWGIEVMTNNAKYILRPLEKLQVQYKNTIEIKELEIDNQYDLKFKPGFYQQVSSLLNNNTKLPTFNEHEIFCSVIKKIKLGN